MFAFNPVTGLNNASEFPAKDPLIRQHLQALLQQIPSYVDAQLAVIPNKKNVINPTLINNYINSDIANYYGAEVWKDSMGYVHIRGMIQVSAGGTDSTVPFYLPTEYRPVKSYDFPLRTNLTIACSVRVRADGAVIVYTPSSVADYINFGEIIFRAGD